MLLNYSSWTYAGKLQEDFTTNLKAINAIALLFNKQRIKLKITLSTLELILNLLGSSNPRLMPNEGERIIIIKDTEKSLLRDYNIDKYISLSSMRYGRDRTYIITIRTKSSLMTKLMVLCNRDCEYYVDEKVNTARNNSSTYFQLVLKAISILSNVFSIKTPRVVLTHNPTVYGKIMTINGDEVIALSIWDLLRIINAIIEVNPTVNSISNIIDTAVHEFLHYLLDKQYLVALTFMEMMKRIPSVVDDGIIHELIAWTLTPHVSRYVAECIKYGVTNKVNTGNDLVIQYPIKRRHLLTARRIINELLERLDGNCG
ncbi:hypothetical protein VMUT_0917 [Vulcanisaeta moutnovskia 768-28]|uniref:Uncharacterized protein n=1 Tax=Vulcanisaeta moutnovskia (strain 768-28) TaxID=985053 RepID=F0QX09_VULM7|nr:hypothetical protein [Vulcanisaeta moutnovskia]ADY01127.1 hypothetical protein VMUT_0917 [Vulcanisaeta moutnovskia 768-28]